MSGDVQSADAVIAGGGLHGLSSALHLAQAGLHVVLLEKDRVGRHASSANAGGVRRLGRALPEIPLADAALQRWHRIAELVDDDCGFAETAQIKVAETPDELGAQEDRCAAVRDSGFSHEQIIDAADARALLPEVTERCVGGIIVRGDGHANPFRTVRAFHRKALALGAEVREHCALRTASHDKGNWRIETDAGTFVTPIFINAAGAWGGQIARMMGDDVPLTPQALMLMITERVRPFLSAVVGAQGRTLSFKQFDNGTVLIGGGYQGRADTARNATTLNLRGLAANAGAAAAVFPLMQKVRILRAWAGIEGVTPDHLPVIGPAAAPGGYHLFGFSAHGFALAPIGGQIIADLVLSRQSSLPITAFDARRFSAKRATC